MPQKGAFFNLIKQFKSIYNLGKFIEECKQKFQDQSCFLCGNLHHVHIHAYPWRKIRNSEFERNESIRIITIICKTAKKQGKPYTRRLLPDFLMPGCVIRLDKALEAYRVAGDPRDIELACHTMQCIDIRTARKHLDRIEEAIRHASVEAAESIVLSPETGDMPVTTPESTPLVVLTSLLESLGRARLRSGTPTEVPSVLSFVQQIRWRIFLKQPSATVMTKRHPP